MRNRKSWDWEDWGREADDLHQRRRWKEALPCFTRALRDNPLDTASRDAYRSDLEGKTDCLVRLGRFREAIRCIDELKTLPRRRANRRS